MTRIDRRLRERRGEQTREHWSCGNAPVVTPRHQDGLLLRHMASAFLLLQNRCSSAKLNLAQKNDYAGCKVIFVFIAGKAVTF